MQRLNVRHGAGPSEPKFAPPIVTQPQLAVQGSLAMMQPKHNALNLSTQAMHGHANAKSATDSMAASKHAIMWIDGVGGFLLWDKPELVLGQAYADSHADIGITGDLSRRAAVIRRMGSDYLLQPLQATCLNGQPIDRPQLLRDGTLIELGNTVKLRFRKPNALSGTARLEMASIHRWKPNVDAVLLLADCCMVGPRAGSHVPCSDWRNEVLLVQKPGGTAPAPYNNWQLRIAEEVQVNGLAMRGQFAIGPDTHIRGEDFSLSFE